ncbi:MAG: LysM peptidoglycan-binding domain-containing protein [Planctomycetes bacterium]|nr:LysM peptidoglycan-binding domain-containing protein [Planctomycetota bacterium]
MTADAKVGLLLGLVFIVMIAFLINGLPGFLQAAPSDNPVATEITIPKASDLVIDDRVFETVQSLRQQDIPLRQTELPQEVIVLDDRSASSNLTDRISPEQIAPAAVQMPTIQPEVPISASSSSKPMFHVVQSGETLPTIARKHYGNEKGNRLIVIEKLYEANKKVLRSPDKIFVGDKLTIPSYDQLMGSKPQPAVKTSSKTSAAENSFMEKFSNLFERADQSNASNPVRIYVVQEGDTLWSIAAALLGEGNHYPEIQKANPNIRESDNLIVGTNLKIPNR